MYYVSISQEICLSITNAVFDSMTSYTQQKYSDNEKGGILIGEIVYPKGSYIIQDMTYPFSTDISSPFRFTRNESGHQEYMDKIWDLSDHTKTYLGEWHTHFERIPNPSTIDIHNWRKISQRRHNCECLFFIIVGCNQIRVWASKNEKIVELLLRKNGDYV